MTADHLNSPSSSESVPTDSQQETRKLHALNALRKAAGWAVAEGMTAGAFRDAAEDAFYTIEQDPPHV